MPPCRWTIPPRRRHPHATPAQPWQPTWWHGPPKTSPRRRQQTNRHRDLSLLAPVTPPGTVTARLARDRKRSRSTADPHCHRGQRPNSPPGPGRRPPPARGQAARPRRAPSTAMRRNRRPLRSPHPPRPPLTRRRRSRVQHRLSTPHGTSPAPTSSPPSRRPLMVPSTHTHHDPKTTRQATHRRSTTVRRPPPTSGDHPPKTLPRNRPARWCA